MKDKILYAEEINKSKWDEHRVFLSSIKLKVDEINKKFKYDPITDKFNKNTTH